VFYPESHPFHHNNISSHKSVESHLIKVKTHNNNISHKSHNTNIKTNITVVDHYKGTETILSATSISEEYIDKVIVVILLLCQEGRWRGLIYLCKVHSLSYNSI
jgi:hypothetical protein